MKLEQTKLKSRGLQNTLISDVKPNKIDQSEITVKARVNGNVFALAGGVGSGKTTAAAQLSLENNFCFIEEYMQMLDNLDSFYENDAETRLRVLLNIESERKKIISKKTKNQVVLIDRCVLCLMAHEYAKAKLEANYNLNKMLVLLKQNELLIPNVLFFLTTNEFTRRQRCSIRKTKMPDLFLSDEYNKLLLKFYLKISKQISIYFIDTTNLTMTAIVSKIDKLLKKHQLISNFYTRKTDLCLPIQ